MDIGQIATGLSLSNTASSVTMGVMSDVQNLQSDLVARLFGSLGVGTNFDAYA
jgi:hypothetical protein